DVAALAQLFQAMLPLLDFPRALLRGRYLSAIARIEWAGIPCDIARLETLLHHWDTLRGRLVQAVNQDYHVFVPQGLTLDPATTLGRTILTLAAASDLDPYALALAADQLWRDQRELYRETVQVRRTARQRTGLTPAAMARWARAGYDASTWPGLDDMAQELAGELPT